MQSKSKTRVGGLRSRTIVCSLAWSALLVAGLTACTSPAPSEVTDASIGRSEVTDDATNASPREPIVPLEVSPFDEFRNLLWSQELDQDAFRRQFEADRVREENLIAQCMRELGFDYYPDIGGVTLSFGGDNSWRPDDPDWVATYGYGWVVSPLVPRGDIPHFDHNFWRDDNPNYAIYNSLSETEQVEWDRAFAGNSPTVFTRNVGGHNFHDCSNWARHLVWYERQQVTSDEFAPLLEAIGMMHDELHWGLSEADRAWSVCMADAGYPELERQWEASDAILRELNAAQSALSLAGETGPFTPANSPTIAALHEREVALATADLNCRVSTGFAAGRQTHIHAVEDQFIIDHREALEALRSAVEQGN